MSTPVDCLSEFGELPNYCYINGERLSFFNPLIGEIQGDRSPFSPIQLGRTDPQISQNPVKFTVFRIVVGEIALPKLHP